MAAPTGHEDWQTVRSYIESVYGQSLRDPAGPLRHPFIDPGAGYRDLCWDWDAFFCAAGLADWGPAVGPYLRGCLLNFLDFMRPDGSVPYCLNARQENIEIPAVRPSDSPANSIKPLLGQMACMAADYLADDSWFAEVYGKLTRYLDHWQQTQRSALGLYVFRSHRGSGSDNHPGVYGRPLNSAADVFLNCLFVREYEAMVRIAGSLGRGEDTAGWQQRRDALAGAIQQMWDPIDGMFYNVDVQRHPIENTRQQIDWLVPLKFRHWTGLMPLWAGVATEDQAVRLIEHLTDPRQFWSGHGMRSMAANEPAYCNFADHNPSNWQGPIWVVANWLIYDGLKRYGFCGPADSLADDLLATLAADIRKNGCLHEYYHGQTGIGLTHPGFVNWNTLAAGMEPAET
jgi:putative isomerase